MGHSTEVEFDMDFIDDTIERLHRLKPGAAPLWGALDPEAMISHLIVSLRYTMGQYGTSSPSGNWYTRAVLGRLILWGLIPIPKNLRMPFPSRDAERPRGDLETLHAVMEEYLALVQGGGLDPAPHPAFGALGVDGWARYHVLHFEHHLKQFGV